MAFTVQVGLKFTGLMADFVYREDIGFGNGFLTANLLGGMFGMYNTVQQYLYLYMPLLTMGLMSREFSSGSIKLLYSSPVTSSQIIMGKFLAMMAYGLVLLGTLILYIGYAACVVDNFAFAEALSGLLGLYLLLCAYAAIGLFVFVSDFLSSGCGYRDVDYSGRAELHESGVAGYSVCQGHHILVVSFRAYERDDQRFVV